MTTFCLQTGGKGPALQETYRTQPDPKELIRNGGGGIGRILAGVQHRDGSGGGAVGKSNAGTESARTPPSRCRPGGPELAVAAEDSGAAAADRSPSGYPPMASIQTPGCFDFEGRK